MKKMIVKQTVPFSNLQHVRTPLEKIAMRSRNLIDGALTELVERQPLDLG